MSQENLELAKRLGAMMRAGDIDGALALIADDLVLTDYYASLDEPSVFHGREAALRHWAATVAAFDDLHREVDERLDVGDWVITVGRWKARGKASGAPVAGRRAVDALRWRDGKVVDMQLASGARPRPSKPWGCRSRRCRRRSRLPLCATSRCQKRSETAC
jgi:ketosteroid isomerase-like protein